MPMQSKDPPIRKPHRRWLHYSLAAALAWLSVFVFEVVLFNHLFRDLPTPFRIAAVVIPLVVLVGVALIFLMGTKIIPWRYGVFGPYECSPRPKCFHPLICLNTTAFRPPFVTRYEIAMEGIEMTFLFSSRAFLPADAITTIGPAAGRTYVVEHDSPEIEGPLVVSQEVGEAIIAGLGRTAAPK